MMTTSAFADINLQAIYIKDGVETTIEAGEELTADAPLHVRFLSNASSLSATAQVEWRIRNMATGTTVTRYDQDIEYTFVEAGKNVVLLQVRDDDVISESATITITISESHLEMPNAFSPNNDGKNDIYRAKPEKHKSIVEFHAYIFNRYGQKLYEWTNINDGWDGTYHGHPVKDGVYYVYVEARGADGVEYKIRRDVNLMREYNPVETYGQ
jgi:gliding motility-associated-like protein